MGLGLAGLLLAGCGGTAGGGGASEVVITGEELEAASGSLCAVEGHATNVGNLRVDVTIRYEARNAGGDVIGTSTATFQVASFSSFDFGHAKGNQDGQPSSGVFSNGLSCAGIATFRRKDLDVTRS